MSSVVGVLVAEKLLLRWRVRVSEMRSSVSRISVCACSLLRPRASGMLQLGRSLRRLWAFLWELWELGGGGGRVRIYLVDLMDGVDDGSYLSLCFFIGRDLARSWASRFASSP